MTPDIRVESEEVALILLSKAHENLVEAKDQIKLARESEQSVDEALLQLELAAAELIAAIEFIKGVNKDAVPR